MHRERQDAVLALSLYKSSLKRRRQPVFRFGSTF